MLELCEESVCESYFCAKVELCAHYCSTAQFTYCLNTRATYFMTAQKVTNVGRTHAQTLIHQVLFTLVFLRVTYQPTQLLILHYVKNTSHVHNNQEADWSSYCNSISSSCVAALSMLISGRCE